MSELKIIKDGLVLSLDGNGTAGYYDIIIKGDLISDVIPSENFTIDLINDRYPEAVIINAKGKLIIPGLINPNFNSSTILSRLFIKKSYYDNLHSIVVLKRLEKYFANLRNELDLYHLMSYAYSEMLMNGVTTLADVSSYPYRDFIKKYFTDNELIKQNLIFTSYQFTSSTIFKYQKKFYLTGFKFEEELTNYSLNSIKKNFHEGENKLYLDILNCETYAEQVKLSFGKSLVKVLKDFNLLTENTIISNPVSISAEDIELLGESKVNVIFNPTDFVKLARKNIEFEMLMNSGANVSIGTGYCGKDLLSECRSFSKLVYKSKFSYSEVLKTVTRNAARSFNYDSFKGMIARNCSADLTLLDMSDIRNIPDIPEFNEELLSEYVIENMSAKDVKEVMINGEIVCSEGSVKGINMENLYFNTRELIKKVFVVSEYFEMKDQYYGRSTVDKIVRTPVDSSKFRDERMSKEITDDFMIVGTKSMEVFDYVVTGKEDYDDMAKFIYKIESFTNGFIFEKKKEQTINPKKIFFDDTSTTGSTTEIIDVNKDEAEVLVITEEKKEIATPEQTSDKKVSSGDVVFKKSNLKFGFSDD